ncbi:unnamed protein product [Microthlaspi erraticum]|uniref:Uncharacterized protein n=1 Tax=Microthlaspi erraticum TaxID=1685480 RepID=A0A6D2KY17_9BRAS|nr:unnamed protein product [Microthlaspi erraticum]
MRSFISTFFDFVLQTSDLSGSPQSLKAFPSVRTRRLRVGLLLMDDQSVCFSRIRALARPVLSGSCDDEIRLFSRARVMTRPLDRVMTRSVLSRGLARTSTCTFGGCLRTHAGIKPFVVRFLGLVLETGLMPRCLSDLPFRRRRQIILVRE